MIKPENHILVIFGASGDLAKRKLVPSVYELKLLGLLPEQFMILGVGRTKLTDVSFREKMDGTLSQFHEKYKNQGTDRDFLDRLNYISINTSEPDDYSKLRERITDLLSVMEDQQNIIFYLATPPGLYETIAENLSRMNLNDESGGWKRIIVEKPFGTDLRSARELNKKILTCFSEKQVYRIDHYLGKETVQNVMVTRFSNGIFEPLWNRNYINHIEITSAESIGVENRGGYYDKSGALRDMVQNHLLQLVALVAMEPPTIINDVAIRNETLKVFQSIRHLSAEEITRNVIRGQYTSSLVRGEKITGYRDEEGISADSKTETYVALKLFIENWRWGGVPFYIRTGKRLPTRVSEIVIHFNSTPHKLFCLDESRINPANQLVIRIQPDEGILFKIGMKVPGAGFHVQDVNLDFHYADLANNYLPEAYQRLLLDCMQGDPTLYARGDAVEEAWKIIDPVLNTWQNNNKIPLYGYPAGTWGPDIADGLIDGDNIIWRYPCKNLSDDGNYCEL